MDKIKKYLKIGFIVIIVLVVIGNIIGGNNDKEKEANDASSETAQEVQPSLEIKLNANEIGEYGKEITLNEGTEFPDTIFAYYVPVGKYDVTNDGKYRTQVNVYGDNIQITEEGLEEFEDGMVVLIDPGQIAEIEVLEHQFIHIDAPSEVTLVKK